MSKRSKIATEVPRHIQEAFDAQLVKNGFSNYQGLTTWLNQALANEGLELRVGRSATAQYGKHFQMEFETRMKETNQLFQIAKVAKSQNEDTEGLLREVAILQSNGNLLRLLNEVRNAEEDGEDLALIVELNAKITNALCGMGRLDIQSRKYQDEIRKKVRTEAAEELTEGLKNDGISPEVEASIKRILIGK
jgi:hypothetical protein